MMAPRMAKEPWVETLGPVDAKVDGRPSPYITDEKVKETKTVCTVQVLQTQASICGQKYGTWVEPHL